MWFNKKNENNTSKSVTSTEYEYLFKRLIEVNAKTEELSTKIKVLETNYDNLRGNFNRKLAGVRKEEKEEMEEETKSINNAVILPYNGDFKNIR